MNELVKFLTEVLKEKYDAKTFAKELVNEATEDFFEVRGMYTKTGVPVTGYFSHYEIEIN